MVYTNDWLRLDNEEFADAVKKVPKVSRQIGSTGVIGSRGWGAISVTYALPGVYTIKTTLLEGGNHAHNYVVSANIAGSQSGMISSSTATDDTITVFTFDHNGSPAGRAFTFKLHYAPGVA